MVKQGFSLIGVYPRSKSMVEKLCSVDRKALLNDLAKLHGRCKKNVPFFHKKKPLGRHPGIGFRSTLDIKDCSPA
jgi:hypothetical protein